MKKLKKIGGYLVVQFNAREMKGWGSTLGEYGVIDEELYTGNLDIDKGALEFDGIDNFKEAIDQARGLVYPPEPEHIKTGLPAPKTITITTPDDPLAAAPLEPDTFVNLPPERQGCLNRGVYALGRVLEEDCPSNDCELYLNIFHMCHEIDEQIDRLEGWPRKLLEMELGKNYLKLEGMFQLNHAVRCYKRDLLPDDMRANEKEPPQVTTPKGQMLPYKPEDIIVERRKPYEPGQPETIPYSGSKFTRQSRE